MHQVPRLDLLLGDLVLENASFPAHLDRHEVSLGKQVVHVADRFGVLDPYNARAVARESREPTSRFPHQPASPRPTWRRSFGSPRTASSRRSRRDEPLLPAVCACLVTPPAVAIPPASPTRR